MDMESLIIGIVIGYFLGTLANLLLFDRKYRNTATGLEVRTGLLGKWENLLEHIKKEHEDE